MQGIGLVMIFSCFVASRLINRSLSWFEEFILSLVDIT